MPHSIPKPIPPLSVQEAAAQIVALINESPRSPRPDELEAVIARAVAPHQEGDTQARLARIEAWINKSKAADAKARETKADADIDEGDRINGEFGKLCEAIWSAPPRTVADLQERAVIARYWHQMIAPWDDPEECDDWGQRTIAELIKAVLSMGGPQS